MSLTTSISDELEKLFTKLLAPQAASRPQLIPAAVPASPGFGGESYVSAISLDKVGVDSRVVISLKTASGNIYQLLFSPELGDKIKLRSARNPEWRLFNKSDLGAELKQGQGLTLPRTKSKSSHVMSISLSSSLYTVAGIALEVLACQYNSEWANAPKERAQRVFSFRKNTDELLIESEKGFFLITSGPQGKPVIYSFDQNKAYYLSRNDEREALEVGMHSGGTAAICGKIIGVVSMESVSEQGFKMLKRLAASHGSQQVVSNLPESIDPRSKGWKSFLVTESGNIRLLFGTGDKLKIINPKFTSEIEVAMQTGRDINQEVLGMVGAANFVLPDKLSITEIQFLTNYWEARSGNWSKVCGAG